MYGGLGLSGEGRGRPIGGGADAQREAGGLGLSGEGRGRPIGGGAGAQR